MRHRYLSLALVLAVAFTWACSRKDKENVVKPATAAISGASGSTGRPAVPDRVSRSSNNPPEASAGRNVSRAPHYREVTIPAGTVLPLRLEDSVSSVTSRVEDPVRASVRRPIVVDGVTAVPEGSTVLGSVVDAKRSGKVRGRAHVAVRFHTLTIPASDEKYDIRTGMVGRRAPATKKKDALTIGIPAAGGALVGGLIGGKKGALIGGAAGGGAGTAVVLTTRGKEVRLRPGTAVSVRLLEPVTVRVRTES